MILAVIGFAVYETLKCVYLINEFEKLKDKFNVLEFQFHSMELNIAVMIHEQLVKRNELNND